MYLHTVYLVIYVIQKYVFKAISNVCRFYFCMTLHGGVAIQIIFAQCQIYLDNRTFPPSNLVHRSGLLIGSTTASGSHGFIGRRVLIGCSAIFAEMFLSKNANEFDKRKYATSAFEQHRWSKCHRESVMKWNHYVKGGSIQAQLDEQASLEQKNNLHCLKIIFSSIGYLARQGLPLRGHDEYQGNFYQLMKLGANDSIALQQWMECKRAYLSHEIQDEILRVMSHQILRTVLIDVSTSLWYSIMVDETVDSSLTEQVYTCGCRVHCLVIHYILWFQVTFWVCHVNPSTLEVQEDCLGLYATERTGANTITKLILDSLTCFNQPLSHCRGQCYNGASNMCGKAHGCCYTD